MSVGSSSSPLPASPQKLSTPLASTDSASRPAAVSSVPPASSPSSVSVAHQAKSSLPPAAVTSAPISSLQQMVQGSKTTSRFPDMFVARHEKPGPPKLISSASLVGAKSSSAGVAPPLISASGSSTSTTSGSYLSASPMSASESPSVKPCDPVPTPQHQTYTPQAAKSGHSTTTSAASPPPPGAVNLASPAAHESLTVRPLSTLPLLTTQASRTAPVSAPPALVSVPSAMGMSSGVIQRSDSEQRPPNITPPHAPKQSSLKPEHHGHSEGRKERNGKPEEHLSRLDSGMIRKSQKVEATETDKSEICKSLTDLPGKPSPTTVAPDQKPKNKQTASEKHHMQSSEAEDSTVEQTPLRKSSHLHSTRLEHLTDEESFDNSHFDGNSTFDTPSRIDASSVFEKTSFLEGDSSCVDDSTHFDSSYHLRKDTSQFDSTSHEEEEPSAAFDTTKDSSYSVEDSRDDTLGSTNGEGDTSEAEETKDSCHITGESMLESSLNNTSQMEEPSVDSSDVSNSRSFQTSGHQGTFLKFMTIVFPS